MTLGLFPICTEVLEVTISKGPCHSYTFYDLMPCGAAKLPRAIPFHRPSAEWEARTGAKWLSPFPGGGPTGTALGQLSRELSWGASLPQEASALGPGCCGLAGWFVSGDKSVEAQKVSVACLAGDKQAPWAVSVSITTSQGLGGQQHGPFASLCVLGIFQWCFLHCAYPGLACRAAVEHSASHWHVWSASYVSHVYLQCNQIHHGLRSGIVVLGNGKGIIRNNQIFSNKEAGIYILYHGNPIVRYVLLCPDHPAHPWSLLCSVICFPTSFLPSIGKHTFLLKQLYRCKQERAFIHNPTVTQLLLFLCSLPGNYV